MSEIINLSPIPLILALLSAFVLAGIVVRTVAGAIARVISSRSGASEGG